MRHRTRFLQAASSLNAIVLWAAILFAVAPMGVASEPMWDSPHVTAALHAAPLVGQTVTLDLSAVPEGRPRWTIEITTPAGVEIEPSGPWVIDATRSATLHERRNLTVHERGFWALTTRDIEGDRAVNDGILLVGRSSDGEGVFGQDILPRPSYDVNVKGTAVHDWVIDLNVTFRTKSDSIDRGNWTVEVQPGVANATLKPYHLSLQGPVERTLSDTFRIDLRGHSRVLTISPRLDLDVPSAEGYVVIHEMPERVSYNLTIENGTAVVTQTQPCCFVTAVPESRNAPGLSAMVITSMALLVAGLWRRGKLEAEK